MCIDQEPDTLKASPRDIASNQSSAWSHSVPLGDASASREKAKNMEYQSHRKSILMLQ